MPQSRYLNIGAVPRNRYGNGPFCKFRIPNGHNLCGIYAILVDGLAKYIGECVNLSARYNMGYGNISPRNCFVGGQETNCRINSLILTASQKGAHITLWFHSSKRYKAVEQELLALEKPKWNRR